MNSRSPTTAAVAAILSRSQLDFDAASLQIKEAGHIGDAYGVRVSVSDLNSSGIVDAYAVHATGAKSRLDMLNCTAT